MIPVEIVTIITLLYTGLLFAVAYYADKKRASGRSVTSNSWIYSLSLTVFYTSWTFYGVVGMAATTGVSFLSLYLSGTLMAFSWWFLLRKMVRVSKEQNILSIADFISSRYGKSPLLGGIVTIFFIVAIIPYIASQIKAIAFTFDLLITSIADYLEDKQIDDRGSLSEYELPILKRFTEKVLAGSVGAASAGIIVDSYMSARGSALEDVFDIFGTVTLSRTASREQLSVLYEAARVIAGKADLQAILDKILEHFKQQFKFDICLVRFLDEEKMCLTVRSQKGMSSRHLDESMLELNLETYAGAAFLTNSVVVNDTDIMEKPLSAQVVRQEGIKSFAHAPITIEGNPVGVLSAFSKSMKGVFTDEFVELFTNLAGQIGIARRNALQAEKLILAKEHEKELQIARTIQMGLLPTNPPVITSTSLAGTCVPAREVGGDYYDFLPRGSETLDIIIADVSGHNVGAALLMAEVRTFIQAEARNIRSPGEMLSALNNFLYEDLSRAELFITMFYLSYDTGTRKLCFANAGHNPPMLWRPDLQTCERLDTEGLILGVKREVVFEERNILLQTGDILVLYTDGITEAANSSGAFFGEERLQLLLNEYHTLPPQQIIDNLLGQVRSFAGSQILVDDVSLVIMKVEQRSEVNSVPDSL